MKFFVQKLGCPKNDVDADYISARLVAEGHEPVKNPEQAESIIVNTCGFIQAAREESIEEILKQSLRKRDGNLKTLYASGCLTQRYGDEMLKEIPELDGAFGHGTLDSIATSVTKSSHHPGVIKQDTRQLAFLNWKDRFITDDFPYSYLKISDGCDRPCTYCSIPGMRGKFRSRSVESILNETEFLAKNGKKEIILVSQEATFWGVDLPGRPKLIELLKEIEAVEGIEWIRPMYLHPVAVKQDLVDYFAADNNCLNYFDLPLQHINSAVLKRMKRSTDRNRIEKLLKMIRSSSDNAIIRVSLMVGFPGETEAEFEELVEAVEQYQFDRLGVFTYSQEEGTPSAEMTDQIPEEVKLDRMDKLMTLQQGIAFERNNSLIGQEMEVIIDSVLKNGQSMGRSRGDCPDVDQEVYVKGENPVVGDICKVKIEEAQGYDLIAVRSAE